MKRIISIILCLVLMFSFCVVANATRVEFPDGKAKYKDILEAFFLEQGYYHSGDIDSKSFYCTIKTEYYAGDNLSDTPNLVIIEAGFTYTPMRSSACFGDYVLHTSYYNPYVLGHFVYDPIHDKMYEIEKAWELGIEHLLPTLKQWGSEDPCGFPHEFHLIGDVDCDGELSVLDATFIQRVLAKLDRFNSYDDMNEGRWVSKEVVKYVSDFNRDGERTILDATAIQMKLAKVEETVIE